MSDNNEDDDDRRFVAGIESRLKYRTFIGPLTAEQETDRWIDTARWKMTWDPIRKFHHRGGGKRAATKKRITKSSMTAEERKSLEDAMAEIDEEG